MSRSRNGSDFLQKYNEIRFQYEQKYRKNIERIRSQYSSSLPAPVPSPLDESLEVHFREYFINAFLEALNWW